MTATPSRFHVLSDVLYQDPILFFHEIGRPIFDFSREVTVICQNRVGFMKNMTPSARPGMILRTLGDFGPNRVVLDVPDRFIEMLLIEGAGVKPALP